MTNNTARGRMEAQIPAMAKALNNLGVIDPVSPEQLTLLPTTGLAHDHIRISETGMVLRVPRQSQLALDARSNLVYQQACFERAEPSGRTPKFYTALQPEPEIPMGALLVEFVEGVPIVLPDALPNTAQTLASIHGLPLPETESRLPLKTLDDPIKDTLNEVFDQSRSMYSENSAIDPDSKAQIEKELDWAASFADNTGKPPVTLISFDAHPGNFIQEPGHITESRAVLVDLEKARYGAPGFDLAHATLYTSTTWDIATYAELTASDISSFYESWLKAVPPNLAESSRKWLLPCRRIMWLWSITWCAKWSLDSNLEYLASKDQAKSTEDWSADNTDRKLVDHVADRVANYLEPETIAHVRKDWAKHSELNSLLD